MGIPYAREVSGTSWRPDESPDRALTTRLESWDFTLQSRLFAGVDLQDSPRGGRDVLATGWVLGQLGHQSELGRFALRLMLSPDPLTAAGPRGGYPLLLQTGDTYQGVRMHDTQHPQEFLMELAAMHTLPLGPGFGLQVYGALAGEPALGPVSYARRYSASADPLAPLGHQWQDSTLTSFGVVTAGLVTKAAKVEISAFNGREPDERRWNLEFRNLDSFAVRLSTNPIPQVSAQISYGYLPSPDRLAPGVDLQRMTASITVHRRLGEERRWDTTLVAARNLRGGTRASHAFLVESLLELDALNVFFVRGEVVQKTGGELVLGPGLEDERYPVGALAIGYVRNFGRFGNVTPGVGLRFALNAVPDELVPVYGSGTPVGGMVFFRLLTGE